MRVAGAACGPSVLDLQVAADGPAQLLQPLPECSVADLSFRVIRSHARQQTDPPHALRLLRARRERQARHCAAK